MTKFIKLAACAMLIGIAAACSNESPEIPASELYTREWVKQFGAVNPDHDWNHASRSYIDISTDGPVGEVQIVGHLGGTPYLLASYSDVDGTRRLQFDMPAGMTDLQVTAGGISQATAPGGSVQIASARNTINPADRVPAAGVTASLNTKEQDWWVLPYLNAAIFQRRMPEGAYNINRSGVTTDFMFRFSTNDFVLRPLFWDTIHKLRLGMFYIGADGQPVRIPLYDMEKTNDHTDNLVLNIVDSEVKEVRVPVADAALTRCFRDNGVVLGKLSSTDNFDSKTAATDDHIVTVAARQYLETVLGLANTRYDAAGNELPHDMRYNHVYRWRIDGDDFVITYTYFNYDNWAAPTTQNTFGGNTTQNIVSYKSVVSKGIRVHVDDISREYGFYIQRGWSGQDFDNPYIGFEYFYSLSSLNKGARFEPRPGAVRDSNGNYKSSDMVAIEGRHNPAAATWVGEKYAWHYLSFEDGDPHTASQGYNSGSNDYDMQDIVFLIDGVHPTDVQDKDPGSAPKPVKWLVACEDLVEKEDFDFNDVVFEIEYVSGQTTAKITPLAAGGTMDTYLMRDGQYAHPSGRIEWHELFGVYDHTQMINTRSITHQGKSFIIDVPVDFSLVSGDHYADGMGGFTLEVTRSTDGSTQTIRPPRRGEAPQMLLIFQPDSKPWQWPIERHHIRSAYPGFDRWVQNADYEIRSDGTDWFSTAVSGHTVER